MSTDQPHNCNIDEAPQNSSSQNLTSKRWAGLDLHWWQPPKEWSRARHRIGRIPPSLKCFPLCKPKRRGYNRHHLTCRASSYSSCSHTRLLTYSHRQPYITAPKIKSSSHTRTSIATTPKKMSFNLLLKQSANHHHPSTSSKWSPMPVSSVMNMPTPLLKSQPPPTPTLQTPPSEQ